MPITTRSVAIAIAASVTNGSANGTNVRFQRWSQTNTPSQPACSAATATSASNPGSAKSPDNEIDKPQRTPGPYQASAPRHLPRLHEGSLGHHHWCPADEPLRRPTHPALGNGGAVRITGPARPRVADLMRLRSSACDHCCPTSGATVLDVAHGQSRATVAVAAGGAKRVIGTDQLEEMIDTTWRQGGSTNEAVIT